MRNQFMSRGFLGVVALAAGGGFAAYRFLGAPSAPAAAPEVGAEGFAAEEEREFQAMAGFEEFAWSVQRHVKRIEFYQI